MHLGAKSARFAFFRGLDVSRIVATIQRLTANTEESKAKLEDYKNKYEELLRQHSERKGQLRRAHEERDDNGQSNGFGVRGERQPSIGARAERAQKSQPGVPPPRRADVRRRRWADGNGGCRRHRRRRPP